MILIEVSRLQLDEGKKMTWHTISQRIFLIKSVLIWSLPLNGLTKARPPFIFTSWIPNQCTSWLFLSRCLDIGFTRCSVCQSDFWSVSRKSVPAIPIAVFFQGAQGSIDGARRSTGLAKYGNIAVRWRTSWGVKGSSYGNAVMNLKMLKVCFRSPLERSRLRLSVDWQDLSPDRLEAPETRWKARVYKLKLSMKKCSL